MTRCKACGTQNADSGQVCKQCGAALDASPATRTVSAAEVPKAAQDAICSDSCDRPRAHGFAPGHVVANRYRVVSLLGRGGMGEVYRADDLKLGQAVALKFLPQGQQSMDVLARFHQELRSARLVSHPNVCRVFDIGEADERTFISMEYVDGEDLASLLQRI